LYTCDAGFLTRHFFIPKEVVHYQTGQFYQTVIYSMVSATFLIVMYRLVDTDQVALTGILYNRQGVLQKKLISIGINSICPNTPKNLTLPDSTVRSQSSDPRKSLLP
jgi:hypothetical protein